MARIIILIAAIFLLIWLGRWLTAEYKKKGRPFAVKATLIIIAIVLLLLAATGRVHWLGALLASLLAGFRFALPILIRSLPFLQQMYKARAESNAGGGHSQNRQPDTVELSIDEAAEVLGVNKDASKEEIIEAHRKLIQKIHPDRGGNDYLAAKINLAKDILLKYKRHSNR